MEYFISFLVWLFGFNVEAPTSAPNASVPQAYLAPVPVNNQYDDNELSSARQSARGNIIIVVEDTHFKPLKRKVRR